MIESLFVLVDHYKIIVSHMSTNMSYLFVFVLHLLSDLHFIFQYSFLTVWIVCHETLVQKVGPFCDVSSTYFNRGVTKYAGNNCPSEWPEFVTYFCGCHVSFFFYFSVSWNFVFILLFFIHFKKLGTSSVCLSVWNQCF